MHFQSLLSAVALYALLHTTSAAALKPSDDFLPNTYLVRFRDDFDESSVKAHTAWMRSLETSDADGTITRGLRHEFNLAFNGYSAVLDSQLLAQVKASDGIAEVKPVGISPPSPVTLTQENTTTIQTSSRWLSALPEDDAAITTTPNKGWNANRLSHRTFSQQNYNNGPWVHDGFLGQGVTIYVLDTGIRIDNSGFEGSEVVHGQNFVRGTQATDRNGHGTLCAGVIAGNRWGLSPKAKTVNVKIANDQDRSATDDVAAGIQWVVNQPGNNNLKVISMSQTGFTGVPDISTASAAAVKKGVHVVVCSGNYDTDACRVQPGNAPGVVSVSSVEPDNSMPTRRTSREGTNLGKCVTIFAPGSQVPTLSATNISPTYRYFGWGTSIAAPQVAALMANRMSKVGPMTPAAMIQWLQATATKGQIKGDLKGAPNLIAFSGVGEA